MESIPGAGHCWVVLFLKDHLDFHWRTDCCVERRAAGNRLFRSPCNRWQRLRLRSRWERYQGFRLGMYGMAEVEVARAEREGGAWGFRALSRGGLCRPIRRRTAEGRPASLERQPGEDAWRVWEAEFREEDEAEL